MARATTQDITLLIENIMQDIRIPRATYRLQFNANFTLNDALELVDYLVDLGISDVYASPIFKPRRGSTHGYDIVDYSQFNDVIGGAEAFYRLTDTLNERGMGLLMDIVPNHMGVNTENAWWTDVLKNGPSSAYANYFDIDWRPRNRALDDKVMQPILGDHYGRVLEAGEFEIVYWHGDFYLHYYEHQFPITPETYVEILQLVYQEFLSSAAHNRDDEMELLSIITALNYLPPYSTQDPVAIMERRREQGIIRRRFLALFEGSAGLREAINRALETLNGDPQDPGSFDMLDRILRQQPYRLSFWRVAADEINYRRFFDINDMAAIRIEDEAVFNDTHQFALQLLAEGRVSGLRIDHPDGLWNPRAYFIQLQEAYVRKRVELALEDGQHEGGNIRERLNQIAALERPEHRAWPLYVIVEKILSETEPLPRSWAVYGTTGYDFLNLVNNLFVQSDHEDAFSALYSSFIDDAMDFASLTDYTKNLIMTEALTSEIDARSSELARIVEETRRYRGYTRNSLAFGLREITAALPIYRTYITGPGDVSERDSHYIEAAVQTAKARNPLTPSGLFDFLGETLLMRNITEFSEKQRPAVREFVLKFQQITGPVMAKSVEDTAFYIYNRLVSLNEVGGHPTQFGNAPQDFHDHNLSNEYRYTMLSSSTHDTKRSEDTRARINVLSEMPERWERHINRWSQINAVHKTDLDEVAAPSANDEYLLYQTLIGTYLGNNDDAYAQRIIQYMRKAVNEAKVHSNWINQNDAYHAATEAFIRAVLADDAFMTSFEPLQETVDYFSRYNSLAQTLLKYTAPGVPDLYWGTELWDYSLVDPDNRRPVDWIQRNDLLQDIKSREVADRAALASDLLENSATGAIKLYITYRTLNFRREKEPLFKDGDYIPLEVTGDHADHICAYLRILEHDLVLVIVPRLVYTLMNAEPQAPIGEAAWGDTALTLPENVMFTALTNLFTGESIASQHSLAVADLLATFPVGLFTGALPTSDDSKA